MTSEQPKTKEGTVGRRPYRILGTAVVIVALGLVVLWMTVVRGGENPGDNAETVAVQRGPLTIGVLEAGDIEAKDPAVIRSEMLRRATILWIIPEGTRVQEGDLLIEMDVSALLDHIVDHRIYVQNSKAAWINARENLVIRKSLAQSEVELARLEYEFAQQDLEKYVKGQYPNLLAAAQGRIRLNQEEREKAADYLMWSERLHEEKYLSDTQLRADQLALSRADLNLEVAQNDLTLLQEYAYHRQMAKLTSDVNQARMALERVEAKARATVIQAEALLSAREQEYKNQVMRLTRHEDEVAQSKMYAPADGIVIYATSTRSGHGHDDRQPLANGVEVWNRQDLIYLQRSAATVARVSLHEGNLQKVHAGMPAVVTVDALPGKKFMGTVTRVAPLPDSQSMWMNPDLKVYRTEIAIDGNDPALRSGMNCRTEIIVEQYADALYVPIQTVQQVDGQPTVYVLGDDGSIVERPVEIGLDNNRVVQIARGLQEGEQVLLTPPQKAGTVEPAARLAGIWRTNASDIPEQIKDRLKAAAAGPAGPRLPGASEPVTSTASDVAEPSEATATSPSGS
jgi:HlyD family secretion protein